MSALRLHKTPLPLTLAPGELELPLSEPAPATPLAGLYSELNQALNPSGLRPQARPGVEAKALRNRAGELYYMLKSPSGQYLKLSEPDYFLWQRLDGNYTLLELALAYQQTYRSFAFERILNLIGRLK